MFDEHFVIVHLSEHDAALLRYFAGKQVPSGGVWGGYWERVAGAVEQGMEQLAARRRIERERVNGRLQGILEADQGRES